MRKVLIFVCSLFILVSSGCKHRNQEYKSVADLPDHEIEHMFKLNHEDTLLVLGTFISFERYGWTGYAILAEKYLGKNPEELEISDLYKIRSQLREVYKKKRGTDVSMIAINPSFYPKIEITTELTQTSLKELIVKDITEKNALRKWKTEFPNKDFSENEFLFTESLIEQFQPIYSDKVKYIPDNSNLSKVFFLQDKNAFVELNKYYYYHVRGAYLCNLLNSIKANNESAAQSQWSEYL